MAVPGAGSCSPGRIRSAFRYSSGAMKFSMKV